MKVPELEFVPANFSHSEILLAWRNDPQTIANSISSRVVSPDEHFNWFTRALNRADLHIYMARLPGGELAGTVRLERRDDGWELSWTVAPKFRGQGLGTRMVEKALRLQAGRILARVKEGNEPSLRIVERVGFRLHDRKDGVLYWWYTRDEQ